MKTQIKMDKYKIKQNFPHNFHFRDSKLNVTEINIFFYTHYEKIHDDDHAIFTVYYCAATVSLHKPPIN
jgi:hypothetical protein